MMDAPNQAVKKTFRQAPFAPLSQWFGLRAPVAPAEGYVRVVRPNVSRRRFVPPDGYGLYDMTGNVWQRVADWYRPDSYRIKATSAVTADRTGPERGFDQSKPYTPKRVIRGGLICTPTRPVSAFALHAYAVAPRYRAAERRLPSGDIALANHCLRPFQTSVHAGRDALPSGE